MRARRPPGKQNGVSSPLCMHMLLKEARFSPERWGHICRTFLIIRVDNLHIVRSRFFSIPIERPSAYPYPWPFPTGCGEHTLRIVSVCWVVFGGGDEFTQPSWEPPLLVPTMCLDHEYEASSGAAGQV